MILSNKDRCDGKSVRRGHLGGFVDVSDELGLQGPHATDGGKMQGSLGGE